MGGGRGIWMCGWRSLRRRRGRLTRGDWGLASAAFFWVTEYISVSAVTASYGFALTATHFSRRRKVSKRLGPGVRPSLRLGFLRYGIHPGGSAYGLLRCTSSRCVWLRQTVAALPPPDKPLHSACRWGRHGKIKSCSRANAHPVEW
ncbi:hypothetical protein FCH79_23530 [Pseudomonas koreensis]|nr:hypothetical protein [Pseudomonas koreensis]